MLRMELPGKRKRGKPKWLFMNVVREDMAAVEAMEEDAEVRNKPRWKICCGDRSLEKPKQEKEVV